MTRRRIAIAAFFAALIALGAGLAARRADGPAPVPLAAATTTAAGGPRVGATAPGRVEPV